MRVERLGAQELDAVRPAWLALATFLAELDGDLAPPRRAPVLWERRRAQYETWLAAEPAAAVFAAHADGAFAGYAVLRVMDGGGWRETGPKMAELETLSVLPEHRGRGAGAALWAACAARMREHGITDVVVNTPARNVDALRFYAREGFIPFSSGWWRSPLRKRYACKKRLRVVSCTDLEGLRELHGALGERHALVEPPGLAPQRDHAVVWSEHRDGLLRRCDVLQVGDDGFAAISMQPEGWAILDTGPIGHVEMLVVREEARGRGVGAALLHAAEELIASRGARVLTLDVLEGNVDAERFYAREGLRRVLSTLFQRLPS